MTEDQFNSILKDIQADDRLDDFQKQEWAARLERAYRSRSRPSSPTVTATEALKRLQEVDLTPLRKIVSKRDGYALYSKTQDEKSQTTLPGLTALSGSWEGFYIDSDGWVKRKEDKPQGCEHEWKNYMGLTQVYDYCTKCDTKKQT